MYTIKSQKESNFTALTAVVMVLAAFRFLGSILTITQLDAPAYTLVLIVFYGILLLGSLFLLIRLVKTGKRKLTLHENAMTYMPLFGAPKNLSYHDIDRINIGGKTYVIYDREGKKLVTFDDFHMENANEIIAFLKKKGVRTQM